MWLWREPCRGIPLAIALSRIASEAVTIAEVRGFLAHRFGARSRITQLSVDFDVRPIMIRSVVITPRTIDVTSDTLQSELRAKLERPVTLQLDQILLAGSSNNLDAQRANLTGGATAVAAKAEADRIASVVALAAGTSAQTVTVDQNQRQATARSAVLPGADIATYRALEQRAATAAKDWRIVIVPPLQNLPTIRFADGSDVIDASARQAILDSAWAAERWNASALGVPGLPATTPARPRLDQRRASAIAVMLRAEGVQPTSLPSAGLAFRLSLPGSPVA